MTAFTHALGVVFQNLPERDDYKGSFDEAEAIVLALCRNGLMIVAVMVDADWHADADERSDGDD